MNANAVNLSLTSFFGTETSAPAGSEIYFGARARNVVGLFGQWIWSEKTSIGATEVVVDHDSTRVQMALEASIPEYDALARSSSTEIPRESTLTLLDASSNTTVVKYRRLAVTRRQLMSRSSNTVTTSPFTRRFLTAGSTMHETNVEFSLSLNQTGPDAYVYTMLSDTDALLPTDHPVRNDPVAFSRLVPSLWREADSTWIEAEQSCSPA